MKAAILFVSLRLDSLDLDRRTETINIHFSFLLLLQKETKRVFLTAATTHSEKIRKRPVSDPASEII